MLDDNNFFRKKFIDYYSIDIGSIEKLLQEETSTSEICAISLSDYESQIVLFATPNNEVHKNSRKNSKLISLILKNNQKINIKEKFVGLQVNTDFKIEISKYIEWNRELLLYVIFDNHKINLALASNKLEKLILNIESILNND